MKVGDAFNEELKKKMKSGSTPAPSSAEPRPRKKYFIDTITQGETIHDVFAVSDITLRQARNGNYYISGALMDRTGKVNMRMWDVKRDTYDRLYAASFIRALAHLELFNDQPQIIIREFSVLNPADVYPGDFLPTSEFDPVAMETEFRGLIAAIEKEEWRKALNAIYNDAFFPVFKLAPAAKEYHHAWVHGLLEHSLSAARTARAIAKEQPFLDSDIVISGALVHDIGKAYEISSDIGFEYTTDGKLLGHISLGAMHVSDACRSADIDPVVRRLLLHIVLSHHGSLEWGSPVFPRTKEAMAVHYIENLDAKVRGAQTLIEKTPGAADGPVWTEFSRMFDGSVYGAGR